MKKSIKHIGLILALALTSAVFFSCDKDDEGGGIGDGGNGGGNGGGDAVGGGTNSVTEITGANYICGTEIYNDETDEYSYSYSDSDCDVSERAKIVRAILDHETEEKDPQDGYFLWEKDTISEAAFTNNSFSLQLPATVAEKCLNTLSNKAFEKMSVSDRNVKMIELDGFEVYDKDGNNIGGFTCRNIEEKSYGIIWIYVNGDVTIQGKVTQDSENGTSKYDYTLNLRKGWNMIYGEGYEVRNAAGGYDFTATFTTTKPSGMNFTWVYIENEKD